MFRIGSDCRTGEKDVEIIVDRHVIAGWRSVTKGSMNFGLGLNCPERVPILSLLAIEAR
jgi:hypothetical protein